MPVTRHHAIIIVVAILASSISIILNLPSTSSYSPFNKGDNGYSQLVELLHARVVDKVSGIQGCRDCLIIAPLESKVDDGVEALLNATSRGAILLVASESLEPINSLLKEVNLPVSLANATILDEIHKHIFRYYPLINVSYNNNYYSIVMHMPRAFAHVDIMAGYSLRGLSSRYSYLDIDGNSYYSHDDIIGSQTVMLGIEYGKGLIILSSDLDFMSNGLLGVRDNAKLIQDIASNRTAILFIGNMNVNLIDKIKTYMYTAGLAPQYGGRTVLLFNYIIATVIAVAIYYARLR